MAIELYYFSGTGNSLRVAQELRRRLPEIELKPIASLWNRDGVASKADAVGFVFPVYTMLPPFPVVRLLRRIDLESARYIFSVVTRSGSAERAPRMVERLVARKGRRLDASWAVTMPGNCEGAFVYGVPPREMAAEQESRMIDKVARIGEAVAARASFRERDDPPFSLRKLVGPLVAPLILPMLSIIGGLVDKLDINVKYFADSTCAGCGTCEEVCPSRKIAMDGGRPAWREGVRCFLCYSCYNYCPSASILVEKSTTDRSRRYRHPRISASEIAAQKAWPGTGRGCCRFGPRLSRTAPFGVAAAGREQGGPLPSHKLLRDRPIRPFHHAVAKIDECLHLGREIPDVHGRGVYH